MPVYNYTTFDDPLQVGVTTQPAGINDAGQIVGSYRNNSGTHGFLYSAGTYTPIDNPVATTSTFAGDINATGQIVGGYDDHGFLYSGGKFTTFDYPGARNTSPSHINASGQVVGT